MMQKNITIGLPKERESIAIAVTVQKANKFESSIYIECQGNKVNAKSIVGMMSLGAMNKDNIAIYADGADEVQAIMELERYLTGETAE